MFVCGSRSSSGSFCLCYADDMSSSQICISYRRDDAAGFEQACLY